MECFDGTAMREIIKLAKEHGRQNAFSQMEQMGPKKFTGEPVQLFQFTKPDGPTYFIVETSVEAAKISILQHWLKLGSSEIIGSQSKLNQFMILSHKIGDVVVFRGKEGAGNG